MPRTRLRQGTWCAPFGPPVPGRPLARMDGLIPRCHAVVRLSRLRERALPRRPSRAAARRAPAALRGRRVEARTPRRRHAGAPSASPSPSGKRSIWLKTRSSGASMPMSRRTRRTASMRRSQSAVAASTTWRSKEASASSSRVARKAATRSAGRSRMNPTVSVTITSRSRGKRRRRDVGSSVANIWSATCTSVRVRARSRVLLPAFV